MRKITHDIPYAMRGSLESLKKHNEPIHYNGDTAIWIGSRCHVYDSLKKADLLEGYECGCQSLRNGVMKALRLKPLHDIKESLVRGDGRCVIEITFSLDK